MIPAMDFDMAVTEHPDGRAEVALRGELDLASGPRVQAELTRLIEAGATVRLDLSELDFMDSAELVAILTAVQRARQRDGSFEVERSLRPSVQRLFELTRSDEFLWPPA